MTPLLVETSGNDIALNCHVRKRTGHTTTVAIMDSFQEFVINFKCSFNCFTRNRNE